MSAILVATADLTNNADAWRLDYPSHVGTLQPEATRPVITGQNPAETPPVFHPYEALAGFKLAVYRILRLGGNMGVPSGPSTFGPRLRRQIPGGYDPDVTVRVASMPAGLVPTRPVWESYLEGTDPYLAG